MGVEDIEEDGRGVEEDSDYESDEEEREEKEQRAGSWWRTLVSKVWGEVERETEEVEEEGLVVCAGLDAPRWSCGGPVMPVRVVSMGQPELVVEGQPLARVRMMSAGEVARVEHPARKGTTAEGMSEAMELEEGDWRKGMSCREVVDATREEEQSKEFLRWL